jgi:hypothetical protein
VVTTTVAAASAPGGAAALCFDVTVASSSASRMASDVVVLAFIGSSHPDATPNARLCDFAREAKVAPGEQRVVRLCVGSLGSALALVDETGAERVVEGNYTITAGVAGGVGGAGAGGVVGTLVVNP